MEDYLIKKRLKELCKNEHLTNKQNILLFQQYAQDKINNIPLEDSEARTLLILGNQKLAYYVLKSKFGLDISNSDLDEIGVAQIGLVKSVDTFKVDSGVTFSTYACKVIMNEIRMHYRKINRVSNYSETGKVYLENYMPDMKVEDTVTILDTIKSDEDVAEDFSKQELSNMLISNLKYLSPNEAFSIIHYFGLFGNTRVSQVKIADMLHMCRSNISKFISKGTYKLKVLMLDERSLSPEDAILRYQLLKNGYQNDLDKVL